MERAPASTGFDREAWYCLRAQPKREKVAACHLRTLAGVQAFLPMVRYTKPGKGGPVECIEPVFPGYLFARFVPEISVKKVRYTKGVGAILKRGDTLIPVDDAIIAELKGITTDGLLDLPQRVLMIGEQVRIVAGIFTNFEAKVIGVAPSKHRIKILIELLGRQNQVEIPESMIEPHYLNPLQQP